MAGGVLLQAGEAGGLVAVGDSAHEAETAHARSGCLQESCHIARVLV